MSARYSSYLFRSDIRPVHAVRLDASTLAEASNWCSGYTKFAGDGRLMLWYHSSDRQLEANGPDVLDVCTPLGMWLVHDSADGSWEHVSDERFHNEVIEIPHEEDVRSWLISKVAEIRRGVPDDSHLDRLIVDFILVSLGAVT